MYCQCNITIGVEEDDQLLYGRSSCVAATIELGALLKGRGMKILRILCTALHCGVSRVIEIGI